MMRAAPPFRADHVGSLLRPDAVRSARARFDRGELAADELREIEDCSILRVIEKQESIGLKSITDGEFRRKYWSRDFFRCLENVETFETPGVQRFKDAKHPAMAHRPTARLTYGAEHPMVDHFRFLKAHVRQTPKMCIPAPSAFLAHRAKSVLSDDIYPDIGRFYDDLGNLYARIVKTFADSGCRYLQLDEVYMIIIVDEKQRTLFELFGNNVDRLPTFYSNMINAAVSEAPDDMIFSVHLCRGNFRSTYQGSGAYDSIADVLFNQTNVDAYFMEYDTGRAGGFEPLRLLPRDKQVVLGVVTSKIGELEQKDQIKRRIEEASKFVDIEQICLSPQCGFASTHEGNILTEDDQWAKLALVVEVAEEIWGSA